VSTGLSAPKAKSLIQLIYQESVDQEVNKAVKKVTDKKGENRDGKSN